jgi:hypothetical protein
MGTLVSIYGEVEYEQDSQVRLGQLIDTLSEIENLPIYWWGTATPVALDHFSYRGRYEDLALTWEENGNTVTTHQLRDYLKSIVGHTMRGYKGGNYEICNYTLVNAASTISHWSQLCD